MSAPLVVGLDLSITATGICGPGTPHGLTLAQRFWPKVKVVDGACWEWQASCSTAGYGRIATNEPGAGKKISQAHRVAYELAVGPIPDGLVVCHRCDNPPCCNPDHLFVDTQAGNIADMHRKGRARGGSVSRPGELNPVSKLTATDVNRAREMREAGHTFKAIGEALHISTSHAYRIVKGDRWGHL